MKTIKIYYRDFPQPQVSTDEINWIPISGYNNYHQPYFNLNPQLDWCTVETSQNGEWLVCFVKLQNKDNPLYFKGLTPVNQSELIFVFDCQEVIKDPLTHKWIKKT